jgi:hypothetical protein
MFGVLQRRGAHFAIALFRYGIGNRAMHSIGIDFGDERILVLVHILAPNRNPKLLRHHCNKGGSRTQESGIFRLDTPNASALNGSPLCQLERSETSLIILQDNS